MPKKTSVYTLGSSDEEQKRLEEQQHLYGDAKFLNFNETDRVCEVGCGAGANLWLAEKLKKGSYIGIDSQPHQIETCKQKAKEMMLDNVAFYCADARDIPLDDSSVDAAFCRLVLIHLPDPESVLSEMFRIIKRGGRMIAIEPEVTAYQLTKPALKKCFHARINYIYRAGHGSMHIARHLDALFHQLGLIHIQVTRHEITATARDDKEKLIKLLSNLYKLNKPVADVLIREHYITQEDMVQAEKEVADVNENDHIYLRLWIVSGFKALS